MAGCFAFQETPLQMTTDATLLALKRFGMGPRVGDLAVAPADVPGVFASELAVGSAAIPGSADLPDSSTALRLLREDEAPPANMQAGQNPAMNEGDAQQEELSPSERIFRSEASARVRAGVSASPGYVERLVLFWSNHLAVSAAKGAKLKVLAGAFEREAIRPHVLGRFSDMLLAAVLHQAMLTYLDNDISFGPNSRAGINRARGYNENLAREVLELHTIGVDGGQTQADVEALALILTGWTILLPNNQIGPAFTTGFNIRRHEPGDFTLLGKLYPEGGAEQAHMALLSASTISPCPVLISLWTCLTASSALWFCR